MALRCRGSAYGSTSNLVAEPPPRLGVRNQLKCTAQAIAVEGSGPEARGKPAGEIGMAFKPELAIDGIEEHDVLTDPQSHGVAARFPENAEHLVVACPDGDLVVVAYAAFDIAQYRARQFRGIAHAARSQLRCGQTLLSDDGKGMIGPIRDMGGLPPLDAVSAKPAFGGPCVVVVKGALSLELHDVEDQLAGLDLPVDDEPVPQRAVLGMVVDPMGRQGYADTTRSCFILLGQRRHRRPVLRESIGAITSVPLC